MASAWGNIYGAMKRGSTPKNTYRPNLTGSITGPTSPSGVGVGPLGSTTRPTYKPPVQQRQAQAQPQAQQQQGGGFNFKPFDMSGFMNQFQMPSMPNASAQQIADWLARAKTEAGLQFDPQLMGIRQSLESALLGSQEARGGIDPAYEGAVRNINDWLDQNLGAEDRRWYARGMGRGGGSRMAQAEITGKAGQGIADIEQERARVLSDISKQESLLKKQAGEKEAGVATSRGQFISARSSDLRDRWESQKAQLDQQGFQNQMQIAQFGLSAEAQAFGQQIEQAKFNSDVAYRDALFELEQSSANAGGGFDVSSGNRNATASTANISGNRLSNTSFTNSGIPYAGGSAPMWGDYGTNYSPADVRNNAWSTDSRSGKPVSEWTDEELAQGYAN